MRHCQDCQGGHLEVVPWQGGVRQDWVPCGGCGDETEALRSELRTCAKALDQAQAALWDASYGNGIALAYAQSVSRDIRTALSQPQVKTILEMP